MRIFIRSRFEETYNAMNRFNLLLLFLFSMFILSCSSDDDDPASAIIGTWELSEFTALCSTSNMSMTEKADGGCVTIVGDQICITMSFQMNGSGTFTTSFDGISDVDAFSYTIDGSEVNICEGGDCNIALLSNNKLTVEDIEEGCNVEYIFSKK